MNLAPLHRIAMRHLVPALLLVFAVVTGAIGFVAQINTARSEVEQRERDNLAMLLARLQYSLEHAAARGDWERFRDLMSVLASMPVVAEAVVVDADSRVLAALYRAQIGQPLAHALAGTPPLARASVEALASYPPQSGLVRLHREDRSLVGAYPLVLANGTQGNAAGTSATVLVRADLTRPLAESRVAARDRAASFSLAVAALAAVLWGLAHLTSAGRLQRMIRAAERLAAGDLAARAGLDGRDELAQIGRAFDTMAERVREAHAALQTTAQRLADLTRASPTVLYALHPDDGGYRTSWVSDNVERIVGYTMHEALQPGWWLERLHPADRRRMLGSSERLREAGQLVESYRIVRRDGTVLWVQDEVRLLPDGGAVGAWTNITELRLSEQRIQRLNSLYAALSDTSQAIVRAMHRETLFTEICHIAVDHGGLAGAAILLRGGAGQLEAAAWHAATPALLSALGNSVSLGHDAPLAAPLATGQHVVVDPLPAEDAGIRAAASFPLRQQGQLAGVLLFYAAEAGYFDADLMRLLDEMATDISFALDNMQLEAQHRQAIEALAEGEERLRATFEQAAVGMAQIAPDGRFLRVNETLCRILRRPRDDLLQLTDADLCHPEDAPAHGAAVQRMLRGELDSHAAELRYLLEDGGIVWVRLTLSLVRTPAGEPKYFVAVVEDILERRRNEEWLQLAGSILANTREGVMITDADGRITFSNRAFTDITGYGAEEVRGHRPSLLRSGRHEPAFYAGMWQQITSAGHWQGELWNRRKDGEIYPEWLGISAIRDAQGRVSHYVGLFSDMSEHKAFEDHIQHLAHFDALTDLPNRALMRDRLDQALAHGRREGREVAVMFLDMDRFKLVNDTLGHTAGDSLLQVASQRLRGLVREGDTVARLGGDEFVLILPDLHDGRDASRIARKALDALAEPFTLGERQVSIGASIGISLFPDDGEDSDTLLQHADTAMYQAKEKGRNNYQFFIADMNTRARERMNLESEIRLSLQRGDFLLHFQPKVRLRDGALLGFETLVRWHHPEWGMVSPARFIPVAEDSGLIVPLGEWILREACRVAAAWRGEGLPEVPMAINVSAIQFHRGDFVERVMAALADTGLPGSALQLELTESIVMGQGEDLLSAVRQLKALGLTLAIDDFGTGYSSLSYLRRLDVDAVKIDKTFIDDVLNDPDAEAIARAIIEMAHSLRLEVVAEGVETEAQADFLRRHGCEACQGYLFGRPVPEAEARVLLAAPTETADAV